MNAPITAERLAAEWLIAKRAEVEATRRRVRLESEILTVLPAREEGLTTSVLKNGLRVRTTGKLIYQPDIDTLHELCSAWPIEMRPVGWKTRLEANETALKAIRSERPDLWRQIAPAVTVKPAKTYVVVEELHHGV